MDRPFGGARGLESLLKAAMSDPELRAKLVARREEAALAAGVVLGPTEIALLRAMPAAQLEALGEAAPRRRGLLGSAATAAVVLGTVGFAACGGARSEMPPPYLEPPQATEAPATPDAPAAQDAGATPAPAQPALQGARK